MYVRECAFIPVSLMFIFPSFVYPFLLSFFLIYEPRKTVVMVDISGRKMATLSIPNIYYVLTVVHSRVRERERERERDGGCTCLEPVCVLMGRVGVGERLSLSNGASFSFLSLCPSSALLLFSIHSHPFLSTSLPTSFPSFPLPSFLHWVLFFSSSSHLSS